MHTLADQIRREIIDAGPLPFARFMARALYDPTDGYYAQPDRAPGRPGDFFTSVSAGALFGELWALQFATWLEPIAALDAAPPLSIVEAGAHDGQFAADTLAWLHTQRPALWERLRYVILEPLANRETRQRTQLARFADKIQWIKDWDEIDRLRGIVFSNELLDAFPVHRLGWDAIRKTWFEWGVAVQDERFVWTRLGDLTTDAWMGPMPDYSQAGSQERSPHPAAGEKSSWEALAAVLPDGFTVDTCPEAASWWSRAARAVEQGWLVTVDYGYEGLEAFEPHRCQGTLRAYRDHRVVDDVLSDPGRQDLTAHVDFAAIRAAGEGAGFRSEPLVPQGVFLTRVVAASESRPGGLGPWTSARRRQWQTLVHPGHLGRAFKVLVQQK